MNRLKIKRVYEKPTKYDGYRILVDRLWPRGVTKEDAKLDYWHKNIAPSDKLRKWFDHDPDKFQGFAKKYKKELDDKKGYIHEIKNELKNQDITLLYGAKDTEHNHAVVLCSLLNE